VLKYASGQEGTLTGPTPGLAMGHVQANLVVVPRELAFDFLLFCQRNPKPCPLLDVTEPGDPEPKFVAPGADVRTTSRVTASTATVPWLRSRRTCATGGATTSWRSCSAVRSRSRTRCNRRGLRHVELGRNVPMYRTNIPCRPAGVFRGPMVVSMRR
jgi:uncharacterized protein YcsI (UPF0317 family)